MAKHWDRHNDLQRANFARLLQPLVTASRTKNFTKGEASVYMLTLEDVPQDVLIEAVTMLLQAGVTWMPRPGDIKRVCCEVVEGRRQSAARQAKALQEDCPDCQGTGWANAEGPNAVIKCRCQTRALELMASVTEPLKMPALPPAREEVTE